MIRYFHSFISNLKIYANFIPKKALFFRTGTFETLTGYRFPCQLSMTGLNIKTALMLVAGLPPTMGDADGSNGLVRMAWENIRVPIPSPSRPIILPRNRALEKVP